jgi:LysM repeat protein
MIYTIKPGDTLSKVAKRNGLTLLQLLTANPQFQAKPDSIKEGDTITIPDALTTADTQPMPAVTTSTGAATGTATGAVGVAAAALLGKLSAKFETSGRGPGTVSTGSGDPGGVSYGSYQMATRKGTPKRFVTQSDFPWRAQFANLEPGTVAFTVKWKEIAANEPAAFQAAQHEFIKRTHYDLLVDKIRAEDGLDVDTRSRTLQDVVWSVSVQHGGATPIIHRAIAALGATIVTSDFDRQLITAIYAERGRKNAEGNLAYFSNSRKDVQEGVANRFQNELLDALKMLAEEA